jgi:hypothetical protein
LATESCLITRSLSRSSLVKREIVLSLTDPLAFAASGLGTPVLTFGCCPKDGFGCSSEAERNHLAGVVAVVDDGGWPILPPTALRVTALSERTVGRPSYVRRWRPDWLWGGRTRTSASRSMLDWAYRYRATQRVLRAVAEAAPASGRREQTPVRRVI